MKRKYDFFSPQEKDGNNGNTQESTNKQGKSKDGSSPVNKTALSFIEAHAVIEEKKGYIKDFKKQLDLIDQFPTSRIEDAKTKRVVTSAIKHFTTEIDELEEMLATMNMAEKEEEEEQFSSNRPLSGG